MRNESPVDDPWADDPPADDPLHRKEAPAPSAAAVRPSAVASRAAPLDRPRGRGVAFNPPNRFESRSFEPDGDALDATLEERRGARGEVVVQLGHRRPGRLDTEVDEATVRSILSHNDSPDVPFETSLNPYRGCEHGCAYCYARPTHELLGWSAGLDFEQRILAKREAPRLLRRALASPRWRPRPLALSGITDPYQPIERELEITRGCLEVLAEHRHPVGVVTKGALVTRDVDLLETLAAHGAAQVHVSVTTLDGELARKLEPRASHPRRRLEAVETLARAGVPVGVLVAPVIPGLNDHEIPALLEAAAKGGARSAGWVLLRLPGAVAGLFEAWLEEHVPERKDKVLGRLRELRGGKVNDPRFGHRMRGEGPWAEHLRTVFEATRRRVGLEARGTVLSTAAFRRSGGEQLGLF